MEHLNGEYEMEVHVADYRADGGNMVWNLGTISIWYKEGQDEGNNSGIKAEYEPLNTINFTLPPPENQISMIVSLICF